MEAILAIVITGLLFFGVFKLLGFFIAKRIKKLDKECKEKTFIQNYKTKCEDKTIQDEIEKYFNTEFNKKTLPIFITEHYIFSKHHKSAKKYNLKDVVWAYGRSENTVTKFSHTTIASRSYLLLHFENGRKKYLPLRDVFCVKDILEEIHNLAPWIIVGYSDELKKDMHKDFERFVEQKNEIYNQSQKTKNEDEMSDMHFIVRDKNGRHWGVAGNKLEEFKKTLDEMDKPKTEEQQKQIEKMQKEMLAGMADKKLEVNKDLIIDVCFSDNVCGELKLVLPKEQEIIPISLFFNLGSLQDNALENQKENILNMYQPYGVSQKECDEIFNKAKRNINAIDVFAQKGATLRVWVEESATSMCDFYYLMNLVSEYNCKVIKGNFQSENKNILEKCEILSPEQIKEYANIWNRLVKNNTNLRILVENKITSVNEDYFDDDILEIIGNKTMTTVELIAEVLSKYKITDFFVATRIYHLINTKQLEVVGEDDKTNSPYKQIIKRI